MTRRDQSIPNEEEKQQEDKAAKLQKAVSYVLIGGVILSLILETVGFVLYYTQTKNLALEFTKQWQLKGADFFSHTAYVFMSAIYGGDHSSINNPLKIMALGIIILMLTPFVRVVASVIFFGYQKDFKYLVITFFVLVVLTISLLTH